MNERFARHTDIPGWDQSRLSEAQVVVAGVGALGSDVARQLAQAGVGRLILCDGDIVAESNLSRGALFYPGDIGRPKVEAAADALRRLCPDTVTDPRHAWLSCGVGLAELRDATLVISCLDSRGARIQLTMRCALSGAGLLDGGTHPWGGEVRIYPADGACFGCGMTPAERAIRDDQVSCAGYDRAEPGASVGVSALIASWLTVAALRMIFGLKVRAGTLRVDAALGDTRQLEHRRDPSCPLHGSIPASLIEQVPLSSEATVAELLTCLRPGEAVLGWTEIARPAGPISIRLGDGAPTALLRSLGVAPREILRVVRPRNGQQDRYIELAAAPPGRESA